MLASLTSFIGDHGLYAVFTLMLVDAVLPAASELVMTYAGAVAAGAFATQHVVLFGERFASGWPAYLAMALAGTIGYTLGSLGGWAVGLYGGRPLLERRGRWLHVGPQQLDRAEAWCERYGDAAVFLGRLTPVVRSFISIPAGVLRAPLLAYTLLTLAGSAIWCFAFAGGGWLLGSGYDQLHDNFRFADYGVVAAVVVLAGYLAIRAWRRRTNKLAPRAEDPAH